jgi:hypothetical protein
VANMTSVVREGTGRIGRMRGLLEKSVTAGLTTSESIMLKGEIASLAAKVARVNALAGRDVVSLGAYARVAKDAGVAVAV